MNVRYDIPPVVGLDGFKFQMEVLRQRSENTLKCDGCDKILTHRNATPQELAEQAFFNHTWRVQNGQMLCRHCMEER